MGHGYHPQKAGIWGKLFMKRKLLLWKGVFNYSRQMIVKYSMAPTWAKARINMVNQLADDHGVNRISVMSIFNGSKDNFKITIDPEWQQKQRVREEKRCV